MSRVRVDVLGAFALHVDGALVRVGRRQVRGVLACLACTRTSVSGDALIDLLWGEGQLPADPESQLRVVLSRARAALGPHADALVTSQGFHELHSATDLAEFEAASKSAADLVQHERIETLEAALRLWRGEVFGGLGDSLWVVQERERAGRLRASAITQLVRVLWLAEDLRQLQHWAREGLRFDPADELLASYLAMASAASGQKAEAVRVLDQVRAVLLDRGLVPSQALLGVEAEVLRDGVNFDVPAFADKADAGMSLIVGRDVEVSKAIETVLDGGIITLVGEAGIGKTALLDLVRERLGGLGHRSFSVVAPATPLRPLATVADLMALLVDEVDGDLVAQFSGALHKLLPNVIEERGMEAPTSRDELIRDLVTFIVSAAHAATLVVDDWHWIDAASAAVFERIARHGSNPMIFSSRTLTGLAVTKPSDGLATTSIMLGPLDKVATRELIEKEHPFLGLDTVDELQTRSGGNPLFLQMMLRLASEGSSINTDLPPGVLFAVQQRLGELTADAQRVLQHGAVLGHTFAIGTLDALASCDSNLALAEANRAGLINIDDHAGEARFSHALVADGIYQMLAPGQRVSLHDEAGRLLEAAGASPVSYVSHCVAANDLDPMRAFEASAAAAAHYLDVFDWDNALAHSEYALVLCNSSVREQEHAHLLLAKGRAIFALGRNGSHDVFVAAARQAQAEQRPEVLAQAVIEICHQGSLVFTGVDPEPVLDLLDLALAAAATPVTKLQLKAASARLLAYSPDHERGQALYKQALAEIDDTTDRYSREMILRHSEYGLSHPADHDLACELIATALDRNPTADSARVIGWLRFQRAVINGDLDTLQQAVTANRERETHGPRTASYVVFGQTSAETMQVEWLESSLALLAGDADRAEEHANRSLQAGLKSLEERGDSFGQGFVMSSYGGMLLGIRSAQNRLAELRPAIENAVKASPRLVAWKVGLAAVCHAANDEKAAKKLLSELAQSKFGGLIPDLTWTGAAWLLAKPASELLDHDSQQDLYDKMKPYEDRMSFTGFVSLGPMHTALGVLAEALNRSHVAAEHHRQAALMTDRLQALNLN